MPIRRHVSDTESHSSVRSWIKVHRSYSSQGPFQTEIVKPYDKESKSIQENILWKITKKEVGTCTYIVDKARPLFDSHLVMSVCLAARLPFLDLPLAFCEASPGKSRARLQATLVLLPFSSGGRVWYRFWTMSVGAEKSKQGAYCRMPSNMSSMS
jgi:hypothetical protein